MPRRSSGGGGFARSSAPRAAPVRNPPQPVSKAPPPAQGGQSILGGIGSTIAEGFSFGTGNAMGHMVAEALFGPRTIKYETVASKAPASSSSAVPVSSNDACNLHSRAFQDCIDNYGSDISKCQVYLNMLNDCRRGPGGASMNA